MVALPLTQTFFFALSSIGKWLAANLILIQNLLVKKILVSFLVKNH